MEGTTEWTHEDGWATNKTQEAKKLVECRGHWANLLGQELQERCAMEKWTNLGLLDYCLEGAGIRMDWAGLWRKFRMWKDFWLERKMGLPLGKVATQKVEMLEVMMKCGETKN